VPYSPWRGGWPFKSAQARFETGTAHDTRRELVQ